MKRITQKCVLLLFCLTILAQTAHAAEVALKVLDGVEYGRRVWLHRDSVIGSEDIEIKRRHHRDQRRARRLMAAHLEPVALGPDVVGVMDHPRR